MRCISEVQKSRIWTNTLFFIFLFNKQCFHDRDNRKISNIRRAKSQNVNDSRPALQLSLPNPSKPGVKFSFDFICRKCLKMFAQEMVVGKNFVKCFFNVNLWKYWKHKFSWILFQYKFYWQTLEWMSENLVGGKLICVQVMASCHQAKKTMALTSVDQDLPTIWC